jgi:hypothetical protein
MTIKKLKNKRNVPVGQKTPEWETKKNEPKRSRMRMRQSLKEEKGNGS